MTWEAPTCLWTWTSTQWSPFGDWAKTPQIPWVFRMVEPWSSGKIQGTSFWHWRNGGFNIFDDGKIHEDFVSDGQFYTIFLGDHQLLGWSWDWSLVVNEPGVSQSPVIKGAIDDWVRTPNLLSYLTQMTLQVTCLWSSHVAGKSPNFWRFFHGNINELNLWGWVGITHQLPSGRIQVMGLPKKKWKVVLDLTGRYVQKWS